MNARPWLLAPLLVLSLVSVTSAQWSNDPAANQVVADGTGDQTQPKVVAAPGGGCWVSWFDALANGFDVRVQRFDGNGNRLLALGGVLVADRGFSSTQDYAIDALPDGSVVLTFRDDRGTGVQITAAKVAPDGSQPWGGDGVQLTNTGSFVAAPAVAGTSDGCAVVGWTQDADSKFQKLDADGVPQWGAGLTFTPATGSYSVSDMQSSGTGAIASFVHQTGGFGSPRLLLAQRFDAAGALQWGASHVAVMTGGSLQFGNFPNFAEDGTGGAVFSWYDTASLQLQCYAQRVQQNGNEAFPAGGVAVSTNATRVRVSPHAAYDSSTGETYAFWEEQSSNQADSGLWGQKFDASGVRQWTDSGAELVSLSSVQITNVRTLVASTGAYVAWDRSTSFGSDTLLGAIVDDTGAFATGPFDVASTVSGKSRLAATTQSDGTAILVWSDDIVDASDVLGQSVNPDGSLGPDSGWLDQRSALSGTNGLPMLVGTGALLGGDPASLTVSNGLGNALTFLVLGLTALDAPFKQGVLVPSPDVLIAFNLGPAGDALLGFTWPLGLPSGASLFWQFWIQDAGGPVGWAATNALESLTP